MKKKILLCGLFLFVAVFMLTGCSMKAKTAEEFKKIAEQEGLTVTDLTSNYKSLGYINKLYIAKHSSGWKVEFYELSDQEHTDQLYSSNKTKFQSTTSTGTTSSSELTTGNGERYSLTIGGYYKHVCKIDKTFVYANISEEYKEDAIKFLKKVGY